MHAPSLGPTLGVPCWVLLAASPCLLLEFKSVPLFNRSGEPVFKAQWQHTESES